MEPKKKRTKTEDLELKEMICTMQDIFFSKLKNIEEKIDKINSKYLILEKKVENVISNIQGMSVNVSCNSSSLNESVLENNVTAAVKCDYPDGSWLGDPENPDFRVRCPIVPKDLEHINNTCSTPEKMSLTLLDYLFPRDVQACSNLSGTGKHGKKQLDANKIHGIKCHVTYMFGITEHDWNRIKLNIDSKCRTAFRRKLKGMPLDIRGTKSRPLYKLKKKDEDSEECVLSEIIEYSNPEHEYLEDLELRTVEENAFHHVLPVRIEAIDPITFPVSSTPEIIHTEHGKIQVIRATKEQFELFKQSHNIEVLSQPVLSS